MPVSVENVRKRLREFDLTGLLIEELGWNCYAAQPLVVSVAGADYVLKPLAEKCGMVVYVCSPSMDGAAPPYPLRRKIEQQARKSAHEHLIVFTDAKQTIQIWQWVKRQAGKGAACREHTYRADQTGQALVEKLQGLAFELEEEERLTITDVTARTRSALDVERVTKRFYDRFKKEHQTFLKFIQGIDERTDRDWYASLMLNRMMFVYFIQKRGFLDGDPDYLRNRLKMVQERRGKGKFLSFYRFFLLRLFHEGLGKPAKDRARDLEALLGRVPYLNGGLFDVHELERQYSGIDIPDEAFVAIFDFFDSYTWHLDERPLRADNEINPDVLGYIFEKYINQKQMGAYYTKEDITGYIGRNTIIPYLFDAAQKECPIAFRPDGGIWRLLRDDADRYIYPAVRSGVVNADGTIIPDSTLPEFVREGMADPKKRMFNRQYNLGQASVPGPDGEDLALPTETWREYAERRKRCLELREKLAAGGIQAINDFVTLNLDIEQFADDAIVNSEGPELVRAFWKALARISILDPTCGSGAFLFAALNILEPLYNACLDGMQGLLEDLEHSERKHSPKKLSDFREVLDEMDKHPNRRYFVLKSIVINNLYGVDIMDEAVEICKLRLFLKLAAQVNPDPVRENLGIEPLPDIDFNIRSGNTLIGYATYLEVEKTVKSKFDFDDKMETITVKAADLQQTFDAFRKRQTEGDTSVPTEHKLELQRRLQDLENELNRYLAEEYGIGVESVRPKKAYETEFRKWVNSYHPFHWFIEFYSIMNGGGFDVIIGNPPYVEWSKVQGYRPIPASYATLSCGNVYTVICERSYALLSARGKFGMIVPVSCVATERMRPLRDTWVNSHLLTHASFYSGDAHPSILFNGVKFRLAILLQAKNLLSPTEFSTRFQRWYADGRDSLFPLIQYTQSGSHLTRVSLRPKIYSDTHLSLLSKLCSEKRSLGLFVSERSHHEVYSHRIVAHFVKAMDFVPYFSSERDGIKRSEDYKIFGAAAEAQQAALVAILNSSLFYQWFVTYSDVYHCGREIILDFPLDLPALAKSYGGPLRAAGQNLMKSLRKNRARRRIPYQRTGVVEYDEFYPRLSKSDIDKIDVILADHFGFNDEEVDFIINFDIKFRLGQDTADDDDAEGEGG